LDLLPLPLTTLAAAALVLLLAFTVFGLTGFGSNIVALPLLAQLLPLRYVVPLILLLDLCASVLMGVKHFREVERVELKRLLPYAAVGMVLGVTVLVQAPERWLLLLLGVFVLANSAWALLSRVRPAPISTRWALPAGAFGGVFSALYGTGGPLYTAYLARRVHDKHRLRATMGAIIFLSAISRLALFVGSGLYGQPGLLVAAALMLPFALGGLVLGSRLHARLPAARVIQVVWVLLIASGIALVVRALAAR
jgi:uncharacterized membrane protein YfcA